MARMRSTEAPMDFQFTSRPNVKPVWATSDDNPSTPKKRTHDDLNPPTPAFPVPQHTPNFGSNNNNTPFLFQSPTPQTPHSHPWVPPPFQDLKDVDMSPPKQEDLSSPEEKRIVATGALRRVYKSREKARRLAVRSHSEDEESDREGRSITQNHYTLNLPSIPKSDTPYILLGYLQFFFNLSLVLVFLYLVIQFILTVQRDVEQRVSEYSMDIVQEITLCASQYKNNLCGTKPIPALVHQCATWETCMNRDPTIVGRARVGAEMIAEVVNGFVEPISWKTLAFGLTSLSFLTVFINALLTLYRARIHPIPPRLDFGEEMPRRRRRLADGGVVNIK